MSTVCPPNIASPGVEPSNSRLSIKEVLVLSIEASFSKFDAMLTYRDWMLYGLVFRKYRCGSDLEVVKKLVIKGRR